MRRSRDIGFSKHSAAEAETMAETASRDEEPNDSDTGHGSGATAWQFRLAVMRHHRLVYRVACALLRDAAEAEDVTQEAFLKLWQQGGGVRRPREWLLKVARHLCLDRLRRAHRVRTVGSTALDSGPFGRGAVDGRTRAHAAHDTETDDSGDFASARRDSTALDSAEIDSAALDSAALDSAALGAAALPAACEERGPSWHLQQNELARRLRAAIAALPEPQRTLVVLFDMQGLDGAACARILGISTNQVKVYLHRARRRLRRELESSE
jgi:RNA polymerase sigma-70 factor (ECF subfamily)